MNEYYTMESVRNLINGRFDVKSSIENPVPVPSWNRYPCDKMGLCERRRNKMCIGYISIFINTPNIRWIQLEICYFRERQRAYIRTNELQILKLFELGIILDNQLERETF